MSVSVTMPALGESVTEGTVTRWLKQVGDTIVADEPLVEVSTDKVDTEIPAPASGVLLKITAPEDAVVLVGAELAVIGEASESATSAPAVPAADPVAAPVPTPEPAPTPAAPVAAAEPTSAPVAAPAATTSNATVDVVLPALGESVTEGTVTRWLKAVGDAVAADEALVEVSTDKVDTEIPSPVAGTLASIEVAEDGVVAVGGVLARIVTGAAAPSSAPVAAPAAPAPAAPAPAPAPTVPAPAAAAPVVTASAVATPAVVTVPAPATVLEPAANSDAYVTPLVRRLAAQQGIDLSQVTGTGVGGRIRKQDVLDASTAASTTATATPAASATPARATSSAPVALSPLRGRTEKMTRLRKVIAERMVESLQVSAQLTTVIEVDVTKIGALRNRVKSDFEAREGVKLSYLPFFVKASIEALKQFPQVNASIDMAESTVTYHDAENIGIAVDTERGLLVPVIRNAGDLNVSGIARRIADLAERTRTNAVAPDDLSGGTFTVTNTGSRGALFDTPIINQPQVAILGTGAVVKKPVVVQDSSGGDVIAIRSMVYLALSYDHRVVDGADAARFLTAMKVRLEEAAFEAELGL